MPASVSEKPYGSSIWFIRDEEALKKPTYTLNGMKIKKNDALLFKALYDSLSGVFVRDDEADGGEGGAVGMRTEGREATVDYSN